MMNPEVESVCETRAYPVSSPRIGPVLARSRRDLTIVAVVVAWVGLGLVLDAHADIGSQRILGVVTWLILLALLRGETRAVRVQVTIVVVFATAVEYAASPWLGLYTYRLENVPLFVPPGHGGIYLAAMALGRSELFQSGYRAVRMAAMAVGSAWVLWSMTFAERADALGAMLFLLFAGFVFRGKSPGIYVAAFLITTYLELVGTQLGNWVWASEAPGGWPSMGNPPSGVAGGYCVFDAVALLLGPAVMKSGGNLVRSPARHGSSRTTPVNPNLLTNSPSPFGESAARGAKPMG